MDFTYITSGQMAKVDKLAVKLGVRILKMMEHAGKNLALFVLTLKPKRVIVFYGKGNNGGGGLSCARYLEKHKVEVTIIPAEEKKGVNVSSQLKRLKVKPSSADEYVAKKGDVIVDSLLGYNIKGRPRKNYSRLVKMANASKTKGVKIVSLDIPTGINPNTGRKYKDYVKANYTLTLALAKTGLKGLKNVYLTDVKIPKRVYEALGIKIGDYFKNSDTVKIS